MIRTSLVLALLLLRKECRSHADRSPSSAATDTIFAKATSSVPGIDRNLRRRNAPSRRTKQHISEKGRRNIRLLNNEAAAAQIDNEYLLDEEEELNEYYYEDNVDTEYKEEEEVEVLDEVLEELIEEEEEGIKEEELLIEKEEEVEEELMEEEEVKEVEFENEEEEREIDVIQLDLLVDASGEMGNIIGEAVTGQVLKWIMEDEMLMLENKNNNNNEYYYHLPRINLNVRHVSPANWIRDTSQRDLELCMSSAFLNQDDGSPILTDFPCSSSYGGPNHYYIEEQLNYQRDVVASLWEEDDKEYFLNEVEEEEQDNKNMSLLLPSQRVADLTYIPRAKRKRPEPNEKYIPDQQVLAFKETIQNLIQIVKRMVESDIPIVESDRTKKVISVNPQNNKVEEFPLLSSPFLFVQPMADFTNTVDQYYDRIREHFIWDDSNHLCCNPNYQPQKDETVLHARGFREESKEKTNKNNTHELNPKRTATQLLGHLSPTNNDKVAIISRYDANYMKPFVDALEERGIPARSMDEVDAIDTVYGNRGSAHDFCFLKSSTRGVAGAYRSTFLQWAVVLSDTIERAELYVYNNDWALHVNSNNLKPIHISEQYKKRNLQILMIQMKHEDLEWDE